MPDASPKRSRRPAKASGRRVAGSRLLRCGLAFVTAVLLVDALVGERGLIETLRARREYQELAAVLASLRQENADLREEARLLREDPRAVEDIARRELGLIRQGEILFIIKDIPNPTGGR
jgi:cell division protein FtsB